MLAKRFLILSAAVFLGCSSTSQGSSATGGAGGVGATGGVATTGGSAHGGASASGGAAGASAGATSENNALVLPAQIEISALPGGNGVLDLFALTLRKGPTSTELYAAMKNTGDMLACGAGLSVELFDKDQQSLAASVSALHMSHVYRLTDGSGSVSACAAPGDVVMAALTDLPADLAIENVGYIVYRTPYFKLDVEPINGLAVSDVKLVSLADGTAYTGTVTNGLDVAVNNPSVMVFPVNDVGRPLSAATASGTDLIAPAGTWSFETNSVDTPGTDYAAYPSATLAK